MNNKNKTKAIYGYLALICFIISILLTCVDLNCFNKAFYKSEYKRLNTAETMGMTSQQLEETTHVLLDYTRGVRADLNLTISFLGTNEEVFNQKEKDHMVDVRALYLNAMKVRDFSFTFGIVILIFSLIKQVHPVSFLFTQYKKAILIFLALLIALGFFALMDFTAFWTLFHEIFFSNNLWLLNPATDRLIMLVPESFFFNLVLRIVISFVAVLGTSYALLFVFSRKELKK